MRVLWLGDACCSTGFARCTHTACDALYEAGHEVTVLGVNYFGRPRHGYPYDIWPPFDPTDHGHDPHGAARLPSMIERVNPDVVVILNDAWNIPGYLEAIGAGKNSTSPPPPPVIAWLAADARNQIGAGLNGLAHVITWTQFAVDEFRAGGYEGESSIVSLGVDHGIFKPQDRSEARRKACPAKLPEDAFIVGVVGRNQPRKRLDLTLAYFSKWITRESIDNAYLYLHVAPTGSDGCDLTRLIHYHKLSGRVVLSNPSVSHGVSDEMLAAIYGSFNVYLTTTQGEGWGLPALEAMACGIPCIVPNWSGLGEWTRSAVMKVPCTSTALNAPMNDLAYTIGGVMDEEGAVKALGDMYRSEGARRVYNRAGLKLSSTLSWDRTGSEFVKVLESLDLVAQSDLATVLPMERSGGG